MPKSGPNLIQIRHIEDEAVAEMVDSATRAACETLDGLFPGSDNNGITSNFAGALAACIKDLLMGAAPPTTGVRHQIAIPKLCLNDRDFGVPRYGADAFLVLEQAEDEGLMVLNENGSMVPISVAIPNGAATLAGVVIPYREDVDGHTQHDGAVQSAMRYLRGFEAMERMPKVEVVGVSLGGAGYEIVDSRFRPRARGSAIVGGISPEMLESSPVSKLAGGAFGLNDPRAAFKCPADVFVRDPEIAIDLCADLAETGALARLAVIAAAQCIAATYSATPGATLLQVAQAFQGNALVAAMGHALAARITEGDLDADLFMKMYELRLDSIATMKFTSQVMS